MSTAIVSTHPKNNANRTMHISVKLLQWIYKEIAIQWITKLHYQILEDEMADFLA